MAENLSVIICEDFLHRLRSCPHMRSVGEQGCSKEKAMAEWGCDEGRRLASQGERAQACVWSPALSATGTTATLWLG